MGTHPFEVSNVIVEHIRARIGGSIRLGRATWIDHDEHMASEAQDIFPYIWMDQAAYAIADLNPPWAVRIEAALPEALRSARGKVDAVHVPALRRLTDGLGEASSSAPGAAGAAMMLVSQFARTGGLPWWSDARRQRLLDFA